MQFKENINIAASHTVDAAYVSKGITYEEYRRLIDSLLIVGKSTAKIDTESLVSYSKLNVARMNRLDKTTELLPEVKEMMQEISEPQTWLILTEGWCGDAAQIIPVLNKMVLLNNKIQLKLLLRDENTELMDRYLTNGKSRSIPKMIVLDKNNEELFNFGPRPTVLQEIFYSLKASGVNSEVIKEEMHAWYAKDKTISTQRELYSLLKSTI